jgi:hypothetical protein
MRPAKTYHRHLCGFLTRSWTVIPGYYVDFTSKRLYVHLGHWQWCLYYSGR